MENLNLTAGLMENESLLMENKMFRNRLRARKAIPKDLNEIYHIACSVGKSKKDSNQGFLIDDYSSDPKYFQKRLMQNILELDHFYVAENFHSKVVGFLIAYTKEQWLKYNENWIEEVFWHPNFDMSKTDNFILIDKTAIYAPLTGHGIGSKLYDLLIKNILEEGVHDIFAETIISPLPNFASLSFRKKQNYTLAGSRYETYKGETYTDLIYHKSI